MSLTVIVTRALPGAEETAARLAREGFTPIVSPMLVIAPIEVSGADISFAQDIVFTSANGVRAFARLDAKPDGRTAWCVGPSTADAARAAGFSPVIEGVGNAEDLAGLILDQRARLRGPLLHIANNAAAGDLVAHLNAGGLDARFCAPYETRAVSTLSPAAIAALEADEPVYVLVHSAKAAEALRPAANGRLARATVVAISAVAAAPLKGVHLGALKLAAQPNETAMFAALTASLG